MPRPYSIRARYHRQSAPEAQEFRSKSSALTGIHLGLAETGLRGSEVKSDALGELSGWAGLVWFGPNAHLMVNFTFTLPIPNDES